MGRIQKSFTLLYGLIVIIGAIVIGAFLLYGNEINALYNQYFGEKVVQQEEPDVAEPDVEEPDIEEPLDEEPTDKIEISGIYENKIVYTTETSQNTAPYKADCNNRGGAFNDCGSPCGPDADFCIEVCAYTCDDIGEKEPEEPEKPTLKSYKSEDLGISFSYQSDLEVQLQGDIVRVYKWGPTQLEDTEMYDGISISFMKEDNTEDLGLKEYAEAALEQDLSFEGELIKALTKTTYGEFTGYEYSVISLGQSFTFFFENSNGEIIRISYFIEDPTEYGFDEMLESVLESLEGII